MAQESLGQQIRALRKKQELTRGALADRTGLSVIYIKKLERGERTSPSSETLERIARALGARANFFMDLNFSRARTRRLPRINTPRTEEEGMTCRLCDAAQDLLGQPLPDATRAEPILAEIGLLLQQHRAAQRTHAGRLQDLLNVVEDRYLGLHRAR